MARSRIIGIDYGTRRVGLAISDPLRMFARPHGTYVPDDAIVELRRIADDEGIEAIVIGWPLDDDDGEGTAVRRVLPFRNRLRKVFPGVAIIEWDERESSRRAMQALIDAGVPREARARKGRLDPAAAAILLQEYLDDLPGRNDRSDDAR